MTLHDFGWFADRLEPAQVKSDEPGRRDWMVRCPVHGGSDSLHIEEKNGKALVHCFGCEAKYAEIVAALEAEDEAPQTPDVQNVSDPSDPSGPSPHVRRARKSRSSTAVTTANTATTGSDPLDWLAGYCNVDRAWLEAFGLEGHIAGSEDGVWVAHTWTTTDVMKLRKVGGDERIWHPKGAAQPRLWPTVPDVLPPEIWLAEGETDVICLRFHGVADAYTAGSASQPLTADEMRGLKRRGVERVVIAYDNDKAGHKASSDTLKAAKECGLGTSTAVLGDPLLGGPKDWRDYYASGGSGIPATTSELATREVWPLVDVEAAETTTLLLGQLHPDDHTILFGDGGTGKGVIAAWWIARLVAECEKRVLIVDYEEHARHEWRPRIERFAEYKTRKGKPILENVFIYQPQGPIWDEADAIRAMCEELDITYVVVDSVTYACLGVEVEKSVTATQYSDAVKVWKRPTLSLAHTTKADADPKHPFGSVFWSNGARITIGVVTTAAFDSPRKLELKKANQGGSHRPIQIDWTWVTGDLPLELVEDTSTDDNAPMRIVAALVRMGGKAKRSDIFKDVKADGFGAVADNTLRNAITDLKTRVPPLIVSPTQGIWELTQEGWAAKP